MDSQPQETKDRLGRDVRLGGRVRIVTLSDSFLRSLPTDELARVREMIGCVFEVEEIDEYGHAWVTKWWKHGDAHSVSHGIALSPSEMEVVFDAG